MALPTGRCAPGAINLRFASLLAVCAPLLAAACADNDGEMVRIVFDREDGTSSVVESTLPLAAPPAVGVRRGALVGAAAAMPRRMALVLIDTGAGVDITVDAAREKMFDAGLFQVGQGSIRRYYQEDSYGVQDIVGDVYGPFSYTPSSSCDTTIATAALRPLVDQVAGGGVNHYLWYYGSRQPGCQFEGAAAEGTPDRPQRDSWYNADSNCVVLVQEPGHNFGMQHSSSMSCNGQTFVDAPDGTCKHNEYGDPFDPMGGGCRHMNGWQKAFEGWLDGCNVVKATASATFTLFPLESACNGIQLLQVPMPKARPFTHSGGGGAANVTDMLTSYYVELRAPVGFDQGLAPMVLVHVAGDLSGSNQAGLHTWLLDMTPGTPSIRDAALAAGASFTDPAGGVTITATSVSAAQASIKIDVAGGSGEPTCLDGTTLVAPGPASCGQADAGADSGGDGSGARDAGNVGMYGAGDASDAPAGADGGPQPADGSDAGAADRAGPGAAPDGGCSCATGAPGGQPVGWSSVAWAWLACSLLIARARCFRPAKRSLRDE
jgi:hypothetical protein